MPLMAVQLIWQANSYSVSQVESCSCLSPLTLKELNIYYEYDLIIIYLLLYNRFWFFFLFSFLFQSGVRSGSAVVSATASYTQGWRSKPPLGRFKEVKFSLGKNQHKGQQQQQSCNL